jgi:hypothetical protein
LRSAAEVQVSAKAVEAAKSTATAKNVLFMLSPEIARAFKAARIAFQ